jgi:hypothetical protein|tara:strand:- start:8238 stop:8750 length:513 start_codon:yes stop_codon:yes gene_type:complete
MATALFITPKDLKQNTLIDGSVDVDKFIQFIKIAQQIHLQNYLGGKLYDKISDLIISGDIALPANVNYLNLIKDYLKDMLIHYAMVDYLPFAAYQVANGGVYKNQSENSETATKAEIDTLVDKHRGFAQFYTRRFIDYMCFNNSLFPEYNQNQNEDMYPDKDATFTGWVL